MAPASLEEFRSTRRVTRDEATGRGEEVISYWNNHSVTEENLDRDEVLHIVKSADGSFYLQIGNLLHSGTLAELEEALYQWALDEGWLG
jgi:hypothetical protein